MKVGTGNFGFDASRCEYVDLVAAGIINSHESGTDCARYAVSVASACCSNAEATLAELPEEKKKAVARTTPSNERRAKWQKEA